ncbi:MAG TPA: glycosyltransferase [Steroidobacteraceae bacterium]|jgi:vancomycin aglycone glucosyltransferase|nr:glycosyltransferase [Steroidobacteraceae bacterium]
MRILLASHGTRGDVQPIVALGVALKARGHVVQLVAPVNFVTWVQSCGLDIQSDGVDVEALLRQSGTGLQSLSWQMRYLLHTTPLLFEPVARASEGCDLIVGAGIHFAAASVAQWRNVPYVHAVFCPCATPNSATPPPNVHSQTLPRWINRFLWQVGGPLADFALRGPINRGRATLGLEPLNKPVSQILKGRTILASDRDLGPSPDDAPKCAVSTDAWVLEEPGALDARAESFLRQGPAPIYIGFGSMIAPRAPELVAHALAAVRAIGRRAVIAGGWAALNRHIKEADDVLAIDNVPHSLIFPKVAAAVHHGGAGTTTAAARAGVPQVLLPHILDQYYWADRVEQLKLGPRALSVERVTTDVLSERIGRAVNDPLIRERVNKLAPLVAARNGVTAAVEHLEALRLSISTAQAASRTSC